MRPLSLALSCIALTALVACTPDGLVTSDPAAPAITAPLAWEAGHPERAVWSATLRSALRAELGRFGTPADIAAYCPPYASLDDAGKTEALATLAVAMALRESNYRPDTVFAEPPPLGVDSVGLFQLSYEDRFAWCDLDRARNTLKDPLQNITCAAGAMARLAARDGVIAAGSNGATAKGLARYWSVIREGGTHFKPEITAKVRALPACGG